MIAALSRDEIDAALADLPLWRYDPAAQALACELVCADFSEAFGLMARIALEAEKTDHHPEWENVYNRIVIRLKTHDAGNAVSARDIALARFISTIWAKRERAG